MFSPTVGRVGVQTEDPALGHVFDDAVASLSRALHAKDPYTRDHGARVGFYAELMARAMRLDEDEVRDIRLGGQLHDIGKIGIGDEVLQKDSGLVDGEQASLRRHPVIGEQILAPLLNQHPRVLAIIRWHHERYDGRGFPDGLRGCLIPLGARLVAIADAFDAMTSQRPYRAALTFTVAVRELVREAGRQFDPAGVRAFLMALGALMHGTADRRPQRTLVLVPLQGLAVLRLEPSIEAGRRPLPPPRERPRRISAFDLPGRSRGPPRQTLIDWN